MVKNTLAVVSIVVVSSSFLVMLCGVLAFPVPSPEENLDVPDEDLYQGDIRLTSYQKAVMKGLIHERGSITDRKWPGAVVPYTIHSSLANSKSAVAAIKGAIAEWENKTCIRFRNRTTETNYLEIYLGSGCLSYVGMIGGRQRVNLSSGCHTVGIAAHEFGHALGFRHEQSRPDRDNYVTILWDNIKPDKRQYFEIDQSIDSLGTPYDYESIMHYGPYDFTKDGNQTIASKPPGKQFGQGEGLSKIDAEQANLLYNGCQGTPPAPPPSSPDCKDSELFADRCPTLANHPGYCQHHHEWTKKYCAKSCGWCLYSLYCYECQEHSNEDDCDNNKVAKDCTDAELVCSKINYKTESKSYTYRTCWQKTACEEAEKKCEDGTFSDDSFDMIKSCNVYCCSDKDFCNGAFTVTANVFVLSTIILLSLNMF